MMRSLHARLLLVIAFLVAAALASAGVMVALYEQTTSARIGQASAQVGRSCGAIAQSYRFFTAGWTGSAESEDAALRKNLSGVVFTALRDRADIEGGLWQPDTGAFAYAYPTYEGSGPKTDLPQAELPRIVAVNRSALADDRLQIERVDARSQSLLIAACPLPGPLVGLTAWTMTRVHSVGSPTYWQLLGGLAALLIAVIGASAIVAVLLANWSRHVRRIEVALAEPAGDLPALPLTGERELDRIVTTLNEAGRRLRASRLEAERLGRAVAQGERLAAVGRVAAGVAHEIRSPIAAMRLKAEMALSRPPERKDQALQVVIGQVDRLDDLVSRLLSVCEREPLRLDAVEVPAFLEACVARFAGETRRCDTNIEIRTEPIVARFDRLQMERAVACLLANALQVDAPGPVTLQADADDGRLTLAVADCGPGPPEAIADHLFDPFVTGRPEGAGLGLSIVREVAEAHGGAADFQRRDGTTLFRIRVPWLQS